jgi:hypothetical protein
MVSRFSGPSNQAMNKNPDSGNEYRGYDPLQASVRQAQTVNFAWLKNGESLSLLQRTGFTILSLLFVAFGLFGLKICADCYRDGDWIFFLIFLLATLFCMLVGFGGLRNVLRFRKGESAPRSRS